MIELLVYILTSLVVMVLIGLAVAVRVIKRIDRNTWEMEGKLKFYFDNTYRQIESLLNLNSILKLNHPLPPLRGWAGSPDFLLHVVKEVVRSKPKMIVECSSGASTIALARCVELNGVGKVITFEHDQVYFEKTLQELHAHNLREYVSLIYAPLIKHEINGEIFEWYDISKYVPENIDLLVIDGPPATNTENARYPAGPLLMPRMSCQGKIFVDDYNRSGEKGMVLSWMKENSKLNLSYLDAEKGVALLINESN